MSISGIVTTLSLSTKIRKSPAMMPAWSADNPFSTFSIRGGCVQTIEKPKPLSLLRTSRLEIVNGVRPVVGRYVDFRRWSEAELAMAEEVAAAARAAALAVAGSRIGSSSRKRKKRFSSASC